MIEDTCQVCLQSLSDRAVRFENDVWLHAYCWHPSWRFDQTARECAHVAHRLKESVVTGHSGTGI
jgi:hypothetical protein